MILGHELAGVTEDGTAVGIETMFGCDGLRILRRRTVQPVCKRARQRSAFSSTAGWLNTSGRQHDHWFRCPTDSTSPMHASSSRPPSHGMHAGIGGVGPDQRVAVVGGGAIGLLTVAAAQRMGASEVSLEARHPHQREVGERLGATSAVGCLRRRSRCGRVGDCTAACRRTRPTRRHDGGARGVRTRRRRGRSTSALSKSFALCRHWRSATTMAGSDYLSAAQLLAQTPGSH